MNAFVQNTVEELVEQIAMSICQPTTIKEAIAIIDALGVIVDGIHQGLLEDLKLKDGES